MKLFMLVIFVATALLGSEPSSLNEIEGVWECDASTEFSISNITMGARVFKGLKTSTCSFKGLGIEGEYMCLENNGLRCFNTGRPLSGELEKIIPVQYTGSAREDNELLIIQVSIMDIEEPIMLKCHRR